MTSKQIDLLTKCGAVGMTLAKSLEYCGIERSEYELSLEAKRLFRQGQLRGEYALRSSIFQEAVKGNSKMCQLFATLFFCMETSDTKEIESDYECEYPIQKITE